MLRRQILPTVAWVLLTSSLGLLGGCSGDSDAATYAKADVTFASEMVSHHEQALEMVAMTDDRDVEPAFHQLADQIRDTQQPEIDLLRGWLEAWDKPVPGDDDHDDMHMEMGGAMDGMLSPEQLTALESAPDAEFGARWLEAMIAHHEGALAMARTEAADGAHPGAVDLARSIEETRAAEIATMRAMLGATTG